MKTDCLKGLVAIGCAFSLAGIGCSSTDAGMQVQDVGNGVLVTIESGSLIAALPVDEQGRLGGLVDYLRGERELFGAGDVEPSALTFVDAAGQERMSNAAAETYALIALHQTHMGVPVVDEIQMGAFLEAANGDQLRRVKGHVRDPSALPMPPHASIRDQVEPVAAQLIEQFGLSADLTRISDTPVIAAEEDISGYLVSQFRPGDRGGFHQFEAVVDPRDGRVAVLTNRLPCELTPLPPGTLVEEGPSIPFDPPSLIDRRSVPLHAVQLSDANGSNLAPITRQQVRRWVDFANAVWWPEASVFFDFDDSAGSADFETWNATILNTLPTDEDGHFSYKSAANVWALLFHHDKLVVFFRANGGYGFSWGPTSTFFVSMPSYTDTAVFKPDDGGWLGNDTLLSHELGHYFGLAHPFGGTACADARPSNSDGDVGGQNPDTTEDDVRDTNPDLNDACVATDSLTCAGGTLGYNDELWDPPWANVMSYHDCLPEDLTDDQVGVINRTLQHPVRANLIQ